MPRRNQNSMEVSALLEDYEKHGKSLANWVLDNGWAGWDPYDVVGVSFAIWARRKRTLPRRIISRVWQEVSDRWPVAARRVIGVSPSVNAKAMGLFARAFDHLGRAGVIEISRSEVAVRECFDWLEQGKVTAFGGRGWGYPFDWQARILIPRDTPTVVNSAIIGDAYWARYMATGEEDMLQVCVEIATFMATGLNKIESGADICLSYTPLDDWEVHNASLFGAEFLARVGRGTENDEWLALASRVTAFSLNDRLEDGTLPYWSKRQSQGGWQQDTYHSGFEIRALDRLADSLDSEEIRGAADRYFEVWLRDFFSDDGMPRFGRVSSKFLEVHSLAESLLCMTHMARNGRMAKSDFLERTRQLVDRALPLLFVEEGPARGYFAAKRNLKSGWLHDIPFIRWGQAWMLLGISEVISLLSDWSGSCDDRIQVLGKGNLAGRNGTSAKTIVPSAVKT